MTLTRTCRKMNLYGEVKSFGFVLLFLAGFLIPDAFSEQDVTINIAAGTEECFYESLKRGYVIDIDYQVIDGGQGSFDISFYLASPTNRVIVADVKKSEKSHRIDVEEDGDYKLCFDNTYSTFNQKTVYFELIVEDERGNDLDVKDIVSASLAVDEYETAFKDIEESVKRVQSHLQKIRHLQEAVKAFATRDKNILEGNFLRVNSWSIIQVLVMIGVGLVQVVMVKSLFDEESKIHYIWKKTLR